MNTRLLIIICSLLMVSAFFIGCSSSAGNGETDSEPPVVEVNNVDELLAAIEPGARIHMNPGTYNLTYAKLYGNDSDRGYYTWTSYGFPNEYQLNINKVDDLMISGTDAKIVTKPRSAYVLCFTQCSRLSLSGITFGHTEAAEACEGGVLNLVGCYNSSIDFCRLYGCGTVGIEAIDSDDLSVTCCEMFNCSSAAIFYSNGRNVIIDSCRVYNCGRPEMYGYASNLFGFYYAAEVKVSSCEVYDCFASSLIYTNRVTDMTVSDMNVHDNHISHPFFTSGDVKFTALTLKNNVFDSWFYDSFSDGLLDIDGEKLNDTELSSLYPDQLASGGIGTVDADFALISIEGTKDVHVTTADEFLKAIASDTVIYIDTPVINLMEASDFGAGALDDYYIPEFNGANYAWQNVFDGYALAVGNVSNMHIVGGSIVTEPRYANVLNFYGCENISFEKTALGHTKEQGSCAGGVLNFNACRDIIIENCDLYGCGILGISTKDVSGLHVQRTVIHDCSYGAAELVDSSDVFFLKCDIQRCPAPHFSLQNCQNFSWDGKLMDGFSSFNVNDDTYWSYQTDYKY